MRVSSALSNLAFISRNVVALDTSPARFVLLSVVSGEMDFAVVSASRPGFGGVFPVSTSFVGACTGCFPMRCTLMGLIGDTTGFTGDSTGLVASSACLALYRSTASLATPDRSRIACVRTSGGRGRRTFAAAAVFGFAFVFVSTGVRAFLREFAEVAASFAVSLVVFAADFFLVFEIDEVMPFLSLGGRAVGQDQAEIGEQALVALTHQRPSIEDESRGAQQPAVVESQRPVAVEQEPDRALVGAHVLRVHTGDLPADHAGQVLGCDRQVHVGRVGLQERRPLVGELGGDVDVARGRV